MTEILLRTKLCVPPLRLDLVPRKQLVERLNQGMQTGRRFTLVSAPAGFGKTTLVREWAASCGLPVAWLSLDEEDSDPARFLTYFITGLQTIHADLGQEILSGFQTPEPPPLKTAVTALMNDIAVLRAPFIYVLDDYHLILTESIHEALAYFLERQPPQLHLVLTTREDPPIPLSRWRARGELTEVRESDLQFTLAETTSLLTDIMGLRLTPAQIATLGSKTEGWISGLQLAALSMRGQTDVNRFVESFAGSNRYILDYLIEEVFRQQPPDVQEFLLHTAILEALSAPLCDAIMLDKVNAQAMLERLEQANLFIIPLDETRTWFRYHHLFADLLRQRLRLEQRDTADLHRRAGDWHAANGFTRRAVTHYLAAPSWDLAAALIQAHNDDLQKRGENTTFLRWMQLLPDEVIQSDPALCLDYTWALALNDQPDEADVFLQFAEEAYRENPEQYGAVLSAKIHLARIRHDLPQTISLSQQALSLMRLTDYTSRSALSLNLGIAHWQNGQIADAEAALTTAQETAKLGENHYIRLLAIGFSGMAQAAQGHLRRAASMLEAALTWGAEWPASALPHLVLGALYYEWNRMEEARSHVLNANDLAQRSSNSELVCSAYRQWALLQLAGGDSAAAQAALTRAETAAGNKPPPRTQARNNATAVIIAVAEQNLGIAQSRMEDMQAAASASLFYAPLLLAPARLALAQGDKAAAAAHLAAEFDQADQAGWRYGQIEIRLLQALAAADVDEGLMFLTDALAMAQSANFLRTFLDKGTALVPLLHMAASKQVFPEYARTLLTLFEGAMPAVPSSAAPEQDDSLLVEALSEREIEVLHLLGNGLTYQEIARSMVVSVNTVKSHLKTIYSKLGVHNRHEAVARARVLHLILSEN